MSADRGALTCLGLVVLTAALVIGLYLLLVRAGVLEPLTR